MLVLPLMDWFSPIFERNDALLDNFEGFVQALNARFGDLLRQQHAESKLQQMKQGRRSVAEYSSDFQITLEDALTHSSEPEELQQIIASGSVQPGGRTAVRGPQGRE